MHVFNNNLLKKSSRLPELLPGTTAVIGSLSGDDGLTLRLKETGFTPGTKITVVMKTPFGDPLLYDIRGTRIALRKAEAQCISLE